MPSQAPADLPIAALDGETRTVDEWPTLFQLVMVVLDPYTNESAWILRTAGRVLTTFRGADCRVAWLVTADDADARTFLGPWADDLLTLVDPDRRVVKELGIEALPALVHIRQDSAIVGVASGWRPPEWQAITDRLGDIMSWSRPRIPAAGDPGPFDGSPAQG